MAAIAVGISLLGTLVSFGPTNLAYAASDQGYTSYADTPARPIPMDLSTVWGNETGHGQNWVLTAGTPSPSNGQMPVVDDTNHSITYTPPDGFSGIVTFTYTFTKNNSTDTGNITAKIYPQLLDANFDFPVTDGNPVAINLAPYIKGSPGVGDTLTCLQDSNGGSVYFDSGQFWYKPPSGLAITDDALSNCTVTDNSDSLTSLVSNSARIDIQITTWYWTVNFFDPLDDPNSPVSYTRVVDGDSANTTVNLIGHSGYTFTGWYLDGNCGDASSEYNDSDPVTTQQNFDACWALNNPSTGTTVSANTGGSSSSSERNSNSAASGYGGGYTGSSVSESRVRLVTSTSSLTGGTGALADGQDTQLLQVTLGGYQSGSTSGFSISSSPSGVQFSSVTRNSDGTFRLALTSDQPGVYQVSVRYNGVTIGTVTVNFIAGTASIPSATAGSSQVLTGYGFMPGELVTISVHSDPIQVARLAADANGMVQATFVIPKRFAFGAHTAIFAGDRSGTAMAAFTVGTMVSTGGSVSATGFAGLAGLLVMAGLAAVVLIWRRRITLAG